MKRSLSFPNLKSWIRNILIKLFFGSMGGARYIRADAPVVRNYE
jgi:hypothetical protein